MQAVKAGKGKEDRTKDIFANRHLLLIQVYIFLDLAIHENDAHQNRNSEADLEFQ